MGLEYKYVHFHPGNKDPEHQAARITAELNRWVADGWRIVKVLRPALIGPVTSCSNATSELDC